MMPALRKRSFSDYLQGVSFRSAERAVFYALLLAWLLPIWTTPYFLTGDGPCHVYNAGVLLDWVRGQSVDFYDKFYFLNRNFEPTWFSHLGLMAARSLFSPETAEKVFLTFYVLAFALGFRYLLRRINPNGVYLSSLALLFAYHKPFQMGYYNYAFSLALMFWAIGYWIEHWGRPEAAAGEERGGPWPGSGRLLVLSLLLLAAYLAHPTGLNFSLLTIGLLAVWQAVQLARQRGLRAGAHRLGRLAMPAVLAALPALLLYLEFLLRRDWGSPPERESIASLWQNLFNLTALVTLNTKERDVAIAVGVFSVLTLVVAVARRWRRRGWSAFDGLLIVFLTACFLYSSAPSRYTGGSLFIPLRLQIIVIFTLLWWCALAEAPRWFRWLTLAFAATVTAVLLAKRLPHHREAGALVREYMECRDHIRDRSFVLPLQYDLHGTSYTGNAITRPLGLFRHSTGYLADGKSLILADNYEALSWFFPLIWIGDRNPYEHMRKDGVDLENLPPRADFLNYTNRPNGYPVDYVMMLSFDDRFKDHPYALEVLDQLNRAYVEIFRSSRGKAVLYERRAQ
jgi:hypothetical protein